MTRRGARNRGRGVKRRERGEGEGAQKSIIRGTGLKDDEWRRGQKERGSSEEERLGEEETETNDTQ